MPDEIIWVKKPRFNRNKHQEGRVVSGGVAGKSTRAKNHLANLKAGAKAMPKRTRKS